MMLPLLRVLLVEDSEADAELVLRGVRSCAKQIYSERVTTESDMRHALKLGQWDLVISDFNLPAFSGLEAINVLKSCELDIPLVLVSGTIGEDTAVKAVKSGASDYVLKSNLARLPTSIEHALRDKKAARDNRLLVKQLEQAHKMEAIGRLAGGLAHDVNNVLAAITLYAELAIDEIEDGQTTSAVENLKGILTAKQSAAGIIRQLLLFSQQRLGSVQVLDFCSVIRNVHPLLKRLIGEDVELAVQYPASKDSIPVLADPAQIEQIILNLAVNARDAMAIGGKLSFSVERRTLDKLPADVRLPSQPGKFAVLTAKDTGSGMSEEILQKIFEPFFTTKEVGKGTGLGLSVIYGILQQAGGTMTVDSSPSRGTTFQIFWPITDASAVKPYQEPQEEKISASDQPIHILLVEDEEGLRRPLAKMLSKHNYIVHEAKHGEEALKLITQQKLKVDLLITDVIMPNMGGPELSEKSRALHPNLITLFVSGYAGSPLQDYQVDVNSTWFLEKPFSTAAILAKINEVLGSERMRKEDSN